MGVHPVQRTAMDALPLKIGYDKKTDQRILEKTFLENPYLDNLTLYKNSNPQSVSGCFTVISQTSQLEWC